MKRLQIVYVAFLLSSAGVAMAQAPSSSSSSQTSTQSALPTSGPR